MAAPSAQAATAYVSLFGGANLLQKPGLSGVSQTHTTTTLFFHSSQSVDASFKTGYVLGGNWGVDWGKFRTELELAYRGNQSKSHARLQTHYSQIWQYTSFAYTYTASRDDIVPSKLDLSAYSLMANVWYDFHDLLPNGITPYVGGGVGGALIKLSGKLDGIKLNEKNAFVFAWQLGAGFSAPITDDVKVFLDYRYFRADNADLKLEPGFNGGNVSADFNSHSVLIGLRIDL